MPFARPVALNSTVCFPEAYSFPASSATSCPRIEKTFSDTYVLFGISKAMFVISANGFG